MFRRSWIMPTCSEPSHPSEAAASSPRTGSSSAAGYEAGPFDRCGGAGIPATSTSASRRTRISKALPKPPGRENRAALTPLKNTPPVALA